MPCRSGRGMSADRPPVGWKRVRDESETVSRGGCSAGPPAGKPWLVERTGSGLASFRVSIGAVASPRKIETYQRVAGRMARPIAPRNPGSDLAPERATAALASAQEPENASTCRKISSLFRCASRLMRMAMRNRLVREARGCARRSGSARTGRNERAGWARVGGPTPERVVTARPRNSRAAMTRRPSQSDPAPEV